MTEQEKKSHDLLELAEKKAHDLMDLAKTEALGLISLAEKKALGVIDVAEKTATDLNNHHKYIIMATLGLSVLLLLCFGFLIVRQLLI